MASKLRKGVRTYLVMGVCAFGAALLGTVPVHLRHGALWPIHSHSYALLFVLVLWGYGCFILAAVLIVVWLVWGESAGSAK